MLKNSVSFVLGSSKSSTGTRPPHHSAARTDVVLLIRRTVRPRGYASDLHSLRPRWTTVLNTLLLLQQPSHSSLSFPKTRLGLSLPTVLLGTKGVSACLGWAGKDGHAVSYLFFETQREGCDDLVEGFWLF